VLLATQTSNRLPDVSHFADHERKYLYKSLTSMSDMTPFSFAKKDETVANTCVFRFIEELLMNRIL
jgi:hypothetical protein